MGPFKVRRMRHLVGKAKPAGIVPPVPLLSELSASSQFSTGVSSCSICCKACAKFRSVPRGWPAVVATLVWVGRRDLLSRGDDVGGKGEVGCGVGMGTG